jgi:hypothetical protein
MDLSRPETRSFTSFAGITYTQVYPQDVYKPAHNREKFLVKEGVYVKSRIIITQISTGSNQDYGHNVDFSLFGAA